MIQHLLTLSGKWRANNRQPPSRTHKVSCFGNIVARSGWIIGRSINCSAPDGSPDRKQKSRAETTTKTKERNCTSLGSSNYSSFSHFQRGDCFFFLLVGSGILFNEAPRACKHCRTMCRFGKERMVCLIYDTQSKLTDVACDWCWGSYTYWPGWVLGGLANCKSIPADLRYLFCLLVW